MGRLAWERYCELVEMLLSGMEEDAREGPLDF